MPPEFDAARIAKWWKVPAVALVDRKAKKATFTTVRNMACALELDLNASSPPDIAMIAKSVGFRRKDGGTPLMIPGFVPTAEVRARVAAGEDPSALAKASGGRKPNVDQAIEFEKKWSTKPREPKKAAAAKAEPIAPGRETREGGGAKPAVELVGDVAKSPGERTPLAAKALSALRLASGAELPPSLRAWLAVDGALAEEREGGRLIARSVAEVAAELAEYTTELELSFEQLPGACYVVCWGSEQAHFLYDAGAPDADGELPVLTFDARELDVALSAPGFDVWLAQAYDVLPSGVVGEVPRPYAKLMAEHAKRSLGGKKRIDLAR